MTTNYAEVLDQTGNVKDRRIATVAGALKSIYY